MAHINRTGDMDERLTGNPQITFFKGVYRRHTNFSKGLHVYATEKLPYNSGSEFNNNVEISYGSFDLITDIFIEHRITGLTSGTTGMVYANLGNTIIDNIVFKVGQTDLYTVTGLYMEARAELENPYVPSLLNGSSVPPIMTNQDTATPGNAILTCNTGSQYNITTMAGGVSGSMITSGSLYDTDTFYTYPNFYFSKSYGNAFPILALNHTNTELHITYNKWSKFTKSTDEGQKLESTVNIEYINLSNEERYRFINNEEPYIYYDINEVYNTGILNYTYPIRQIFFIGTQTEISDQMSSINTPVSLTASLITSITIKIKGTDIYDTQSNHMEIYTKHNIYRCYPGYGRELATTAAKSYGYNDSIGIYSPSLDPMDSSQPNGHISANTDIEVNYTSDDDELDNIRIFIESIKFFNIASGQLSLLYI